MSIVTFLIVFILTLLLQRWLHQHIQGFALVMTGNSGCALRLLFYLLLPGVILHEASHYIVAKLLLVRTGKVEIGLGNLHGKRVTFGSVHIEHTDPLRESLIGVAPFLFGVGAIWFIAAWGFDVWPQSGATWELMFRRVWQYADDWTTWLDLYLIFAVSTAMIPSESDRAPWGPVLAVFGVIVMALFVMGWTPNIPPSSDDPGASGTRRADLRAGTRGHHQQRDCVDVVDRGDDLGAVERQTRRVSRAPPVEEIIFLSARSG
jgi:hypothetical protein